LTDPLSLRCYPLGFLDELCTVDVSGMRDGGIGCPVLVIAARGDPLFSFAYTRRVVDCIRRLVAAPTTAEKGGRDEPATH
jgi:hypothetical protein